jgi:hypothetical protein
MPGFGARLHTGEVTEVVRIRRPVGGGHFLSELSHYPFLVLAVLVVVIAVLVYVNRR